MDWIINLLWIGIGLIVLFWGYKLFRIWLALSGFVLGSELGFVLSGYYTESEILTVVAGVVLGLLIASLAFFFYRLGVITLGFLIGGVLAIVVFFLFGMLPTWWIFLIGALPFALLGRLPAGTLCQNRLVPERRLSGDRWCIRLAPRHPGIHGAFRGYPLVFLPGHGNHRRCGDWLSIQQHQRSGTGHRQTTKLKPGF
jgi:hypothetical protein